MRLSRQQKIAFRWIAGCLLGACGLLAFWTWQGLNVDSTAFQSVSNELVEPAIPAPEVTANSEECFDLIGRAAKLSPNPFRSAHQTQEVVLGPGFTYPHPVNFRGAGCASGTEVHSMLGREDDITGPSFLIINSFDRLGHGSALVLPVCKSTSTDASNCVLEPQFSPDGRYVLFKFGWGDSLQTLAGTCPFRIYVYDRVTGKTVLACKTSMEYAPLSWSPDGEYIACSLGEVNPLGGRNDDTGAVHTLCLCQWRTGTMIPVKKGLGIWGPWTWRGKHDLIFQFYTRPVDQAPQLYEYSVESHQSTALYQNGSLPQASQIGHQIAFFAALPAGAEIPDVVEQPVGPDDWKEEQPVTVVVAKEGDDLHNVPVERSRGYFIMFRWRPDGRNLVLMNEVATSTGAALTVINFDTATRKARTLARIALADGYQLHSDNHALFAPLDVSVDGTRLMVKTETTYALGGGVGDQTLGTRSALIEVNLETGKCLEIGHTVEPLGIDWHYSTDTGATKMP